MTDKDTKIRRNVIKLFRYMINKKANMLQLYKQKGIQIFIARIVETEPIPEKLNEIIEAIKFIRTWI